MATARIAEGGAVTQFAVLDALLAGAYESGLPAAELRGLGDFGLGCCDRLGGEVVLVDGELYECAPDGEVARMADDETLPFAMGCTCTSSPRTERAAGTSSTSSCDPASCGSPRTRDSSCGCRPMSGSCAPS